MKKTAIVLLGLVSLGAATLISPAAASANPAPPSGYTNEDFRTLFPQESECKAYGSSHSFTKWICVLEVRDGQKEAWALYGKLK